MEFGLGLLFSNRVNKKRIVGHRTKIEKTRKRMKTPVRPRYLPPPYQDAAEFGHLILRDGTTAQFVWPGRKTVKLCGLSSSECRLNRADWRFFSAAGPHCRTARCPVRRFRPAHRR